MDGDSNGNDGRQVDVEGAEGEVYVPIELDTKPHIGVKEEATPFLVHNQHILNGYRINYDTWYMTFWSLFQVHNETVNVWTHLLGFLACSAALVIMSYSKVVDDPLGLQKNSRHFLYLLETGIDEA